MKYENELNDTKRIINGFQEIAPNQTSLVTFARNKLADEETKGVKLSYLKRVVKELSVCAKATFGKLQLEAFNLLIADTVFGNSRNAAQLEKIAAQTEIMSEDEYRDIMLELDTFLQQNQKLNDSETGLISRVNALLLAYERSNRAKSID